MSEIICLKIKCIDYSTDGSEPAWCNQAGCPACVAVKKCPKVTGNKNADNKQQKQGANNDK